MRSALRSLAVVAAVAAQLMWPQAVSAQPNLELRLSEMSPWLGPAEVLRAVVEIANKGDEVAQGVRLGLSIHEGVTTRSQLARSVTGRVGPAVGVDTILVDGGIKPGESRFVAFEKPLSEIAFFRSKPESRAYPVTFQARSGRSASKKLTTHTVYFDGVATTPLQVALVIPIQSQPIYESTGTRVIDAAFDDDLVSFFDALDTSSAPITIAPSGLLIDQLVDVSDGYTTSSGSRVQKGDPQTLTAASVLNRLKDAAQRPSVSVIASSYSGALLPWLSKNGQLARVQAQVGEASLRIRDGLATTPLDGWVLPHLQSIDEPTLTALVRSGSTKVLVSQNSIKLPKSSLTRSAPVLLRTRSTSVFGLATDPVLEERLSSPPEGPLEARQRFLAETATIYLERPAQARSVAAVAPAEWRDGAKILSGVLRALEAAPWIRGVTPQNLAASLPASDARELASTEDVLKGMPSPPISDYAEALERAGRAIDAYASIAPPAERMRRLERNLMIAESVSWWRSRRSAGRGVSFAASVRREVEQEFAKIRAPGPQTITLTSSQGVIPIVIRTATDYAVKVLIRLESDKLEIEGGEERSEIISPPAQTLDIVATAQGSGSFPLRVTVETSDGRALDSSLLNVRSTAYNRLGVAITAGAGTFLIAWWGAGALRRRLAG